MLYDSAHDAQLYLSDTLVRLDGEIVYVLGVQSDMRADVHTYKGERKQVDVSELDLTPIKLGYVFNPDENKPMYLERTPNRQWRQGLHGGICARKGERGRGISLNIGGRIVKRLSENNFPALNRAHRIAKKLRGEIPFSSVLSVDYVDNIRYKTMIVGSFKDKKIELMSNFFYLEDTIKEYMDNHYKNL